VKCSTPSQNGFCKIGGTTRSTRATECEKVGQS
jgi:hypothetical protein